ncbi:MAG: hypothetical protein ACFFBD_04595 [Candidatus Hodarchaeota archaeon]
MEEEKFAIEINEYEQIVKEFKEAVEKEMLQYTRSLMLYGSYFRERSGNEGSGWIIPGQSDVDLVWIVDLADKNPLKPVNRLKKLAEMINRFRFEPLYASIFDLVVLEYEDLPPSIGSSFNPLHLVSAAQGELLLGRNVLASFNFSKQVLRESAKTSVYESYETFKFAFLHSYRVLFEIAYIGVNSVLSIAHTLLALETDCKYVRTEVPEQFNEHFHSKFPESMTETVLQAHKFRLGVQNLSHAEFIEKALQFGRAAINYLRSPI